MSRQQLSGLSETSEKSILTESYMPIVSGVATMLILRYGFNASLILSGLAGVGVGMAYNSMIYKSATK